MSPETTARQTKYAVLADLLREQIRGGALRPGDRLPSFGEMRAQYGSSLATVDRALSILEKDGLVVRVNGSGVFVMEPVAAETESGKPLLGLILPNCQGGFFSQIVEGVEKESRAAGYHLIVANSHGDHALEALLLQQLATQTGGLCVMACGTGNQAAFATLLERRTPFVLLDRKVEGLEVPVVATDNERGGYVATRHLLESGCQKVYAIGETLERASSLRERVVGFRKALAENGIPFEASLLRQADDSAARLGYLLTRDLLQELAAPGVRREKVGLFALNEETALGCYMAVKERGWKIPEDIAVVGFDGTTAHLFDPPLTAVRQDLTGMGREAVRRLLEMMRTGSTLKTRGIRLQPDLVVRNSSDSNSQFCSISQMLQAPRLAEPAVELFPPLAGV